jgi:hypothetical protein
VKGGGEDGVGKRSACFSFNLALVHPRRTIVRSAQMRVGHRISIVSISAIHSLLLSSEILG